MPKVSKKENISVTRLKETDVFTVEGVLTLEEAQRIVEAAEAIGFEHQSSRGPAFGEVCSPVNNADQLERNPSMPRVFMCNSGLL